MEELNRDGPSSDSLASTAANLPKTISHTSTKGDLQPEDAEYQFVDGDPIEEIALLRDKQELLRQEREEVREMLYMIEAEIQYSTETSQSVVGLNERTQAEIEDLRSAMVQFEEDMEVKLELGVRLSQMETLYAESQRRLARINERIHEHSDQRKQYKDTLDDLEDKLRRLEAELEAKSMLTWLKLEKEDASPATTTSIIELTDSSTLHSQDRSAEQEHHEAEKFAFSDEKENRAQALLQELWEVQSLLAKERAKVVELELQILNSNGSATEADLDHGRLVVDRLERVVETLKAATAAKEHE